MVENCFAYGTLMCEEIMEEVAGARLQSESGLLKGFRRYVVRGELYPGIVPLKGSEVPGIVYRGLSPEAWRRLDEFEGELYERRAVEILLPDGKSLRAGTYVVKPEFITRLEPVDWKFEKFLEKGKALFRKNYKGYGEIR